MTEPAETLTLGATLPWHKLFDKLPPGSDGLLPQYDAARGNQLEVTSQSIQRPNHDV